MKVNMRNLTRMLGAIALLAAAMALMRPGSATAPAPACGGACATCPKHAEELRAKAAGPGTPPPAADSRAQGVETTPALVSAATPATAKATPEKMPMFKASRCKDCEKCVAACPTGALKRKVVDGEVVYEVNPALCDGCGKCVEACRKKALTMQPTGEGAAK